MRQQGYHQRLELVQAADPQGEVEGQSEPPARPPGTPGACAAAPCGGHTAGAAGSMVTCGAGC